MNFAGPTNYFTLDPQFPISTSGFKITLIPKFQFLTYEQTPEVTGFTASWPNKKIVIPLETGGLSDDIEVPVTLSWTTTSTVPSLVSGKFLQTIYEYKVNGTPTASGFPYTFTPYSSAADAVAPLLRCDINMARANSKGCIFPQAAAVNVVDSSAYPEVAYHIRLAAAGANNGMAGPAPYGFSLKPGTRAVGIETETVHPLEYVYEADKEANRNAACNYASSIIAVRPSTSASCTAASYPNGATGCTCDEYPYASTRQGAALFPSTSSAMYLNDTQNKNAGSSISKFLLAERVFRYEYPELNNYRSGDQYWVIVK